MKIFNYSSKRSRNVYIVLEIKTYLIFSDKYNIKHEIVSEMENKLITSQTIIQKQGFSTRLNVNKSSCVSKKSKKVTEMKRKKYGAKLNLPCCIGSKNPCNRQKILNLSQRKYQKTVHGIKRNHSGTSYAEMVPRNVGGTKA